MTVRKPFCKDLYSTYDNTAKAALITILKADGHTIEQVEENYYADVVSVKDGVTYHNEAEVKRAWGDEWPTSWTDIRIPERKSRLLKKYKGNVNFYVFNNDLSQCWHIKGAQLTEESLAVANGFNILRGEKFFHVPYKEAELIGGN